MRVLTIGNMYPPHHLGGYEVTWESSVSHLRGKGHEVRVLTTDFEREKADHVSAESEVYRELRWYWRDHHFPRPSLPERWRLERHNSAVLDRHFAEFRPDVIGWWAMGGMSLSLIARARRAGFPASAVVCDDWLLYGPRVDAWTRMAGRHPWLAAVLEAASGIPARVDMSGVGSWVFLSETIHEPALAAGWSLRDANVCHRGADRDLFRAASPRSWEWKLLYVGRIDRRKGIDLAVRGLAICPGEATLTVDGPGDQSYLEELRELVGGLGLDSRVSFTHRPRELLPQLYADADALLFPVVWKEPWGLVPLEAMSVGRPVIATGRGGSGEYLRHEHNCLIFDPERGPRPLAEAIRRLASDPALRARLRQGGFDTGARFSEDSFNAAVEQALQRAALSRRQ